MTISIELTSDEQARLEELAARRGYAVLEYLQALIDEDAQKQGETPIFEDTDDEGDPLDDFRKAWDDIKHDRVMTVEEFLKAVGRGD